MGFGRSSQEKAALQSQRNLIEQQAEKSALETATEKDLYNRSLGPLNQTQNFFSKLLQGDRKTLARYFGTAIETERGALENARNTIMRDLPAGGEQGAILAALEGNVGRELTNILSSGASVGAQGLGGIFQQLLGGAAQFGSTGTQSAYTGVIGNQGILRNEAARAQAKAAMLGSLLGGAGQALGAATFARLFPVQEK